MKKFIALILVLVMVLSLSTVAFAMQDRHTLLKDTVNGVLSVVNCIFDKGYHVTFRNFHGAFGNLLDEVIEYHDGVIGGIGDGISAMAEPAFGILAHGPISARIASCVACCVDRLGGVFTYVYSIAGIAKF